MARKEHVSETPATAFLKAHGVAFTEHPYEYLEHGGAQHSAQVLGFDPRGHLIRRIGQKGGRAWVGKFDPRGLLLPAGISRTTTCSRT